MVEVGVLAFVQLCERLAKPRFVVVGRSRCAHALRSLQLAALRVDLAMPALRGVWRSMPPLKASHGAEIASALWGGPGTVEANRRCVRLMAQRGDEDLS